MLIAAFLFPPKLQMELRDVDNGNKVSLRFGTEESVESMHLNLLILYPLCLSLQICWAMVMVIGLKVINLSRLD